MPSPASAVSVARPVTHDPHRAVAIARRPASRRRQPPAPPAARSPRRPRHAASCRRWSRSRVRTTGPRRRATTPHASAVDAPAVTAPPPATVITSGADFGLSSSTVPSDVRRELNRVLPAGHRRQHRLARKPVTARRPRARRVRQLVADVVDVDDEVQAGQLGRVGRRPDPIRAGSSRARLPPLLPPRRTPLEPPPHDTHSVTTSRRATLAETGAWGDYMVLRVSGFRGSQGARSTGSTGSSSLASRSSTGAACTDEPVRTHSRTRFNP